jgi:hypothetical protein
VVLPFSFWYYGIYTRVIHVLENGAVMVTALSSSASSIATDSWCRRCDIPSFQRFFNETNLRSALECGYEMIAPSLTPLDCSSKEDSSSSIAYTHNNDNTTIRWTSCRVATRESDMNGCAESVNEPVPVPSLSSLPFTFQLTLTRTHDIIFDWHTIYDPDAAIASITSKVDSTKNDATAATATVTVTSKNESWFVGIRRGVWYPYVSPLFKDIVYVPMGGPHAEDQYRSHRPWWLSATAPVAAYIPRHLVNSNYTHDTNTTKWTFCAIHRNIPFSFNYPFLHRITICDWLIYFIEFCIAFPISRANGGDAINLIFDTQSWPCITSMISHLGVAFGGVGAMANVSIRLDRVRTLTVIAPKGEHRRIVRLKLYDYHTKTFLPTSTDDGNYIEWRDDWFELLMVYGGNYKPCIRCGEWLLDVCADCKSIRGGTPRHYVDDCGQCVTVATPSNASRDCLSNCWGPNRLDPHDHNTCICDQFQVPYGFMCTMFPPVHPIEFSDATVLAPSLTTYRTFGLVVASIVTVIWLIVNGIMAAIRYRHNRYWRLQQASEPMLSQHEYDDDEYYHDHDDQHWDPDHHRDDDDRDNDDYDLDDHNRRHSRDDDNDDYDGQRSHAHSYDNNNEYDNDDDRYHAYHDHEGDHRTRHRADSHDNYDHHNDYNHNDEHHADHRNENDDNYNNGNNGEYSDSDRKWEQPLLTITSSKHHQLETVDEHDGNEHHSSNDDDHDDDKHWAAPSLVTSLSSSDIGGVVRYPSSSPPPPLPSSPDHATLIDVHTIIINNNINDTSHTDDDLRSLLPHHNDRSNDDQ